MGMDHNVVVVGWNRALPGLEKQALAAFMETQALYTKAQAAGQIASFETVLLSRHGGDFNGFVVLRGDHDKLNAFTHGEEFLTALMRAELSVSNIGVIEGWTGPALGDVMGLWAKLVNS